MKLRSNLAKSALAVCSVLLALAAVELGFRLLDIGGDYRTPHVHELLREPDGPKLLSLLGHVPLATIRTTYDANPRGYFDDGNSIDHVFNSAGWRDVEHMLLKPPETYRILGLGDSYLYGQGVRFEDVCLTKLGEELNDAGLDGSIEVINTGISAMNTGHHLDVLAHRGWHYDPDLVILFFVLNDVEIDLEAPGPKVEFFRNYTSLYLQPDWLCDHSNLWSWGRQRYLRSFRARRYIEECLASYRDDAQKWQACKSALHRIAQFCHRADYKLLVVIFPFFHELDGKYPFQPITTKSVSFVKPTESTCSTCGSRTASTADRSCGCMSTISTPTRSPMRLPPTRLRSTCSRIAAATVWM